MNDDASYCLVFDAAGWPTGRCANCGCRSGSPAAPTRPGPTASSLRRWHETDDRRRRDRAVGGAAPEPNAVARMLGLLGDEWTLLVMQQALMGATRYGDFQSRLPISHSVLSSRLRSLTTDVLERRVYQTNPPRDEYLTTPRSRSLWPMLVSIWDWERRWVPGHADDLPRMHHTVCGEDFAPRVTCRACDEPRQEKDVVAQWGPSGSWARSMPAVATRRRSATGQAGLFPQTMSRARKPVGVRDSGRRVRRDQPVHRLPDPARRPAGISSRPAVDLHCRTESWSSADNRYRLTEKGRGLFPVLITALQWAQRWFRAPEGPAVRADAHGVRRALHRRHDLRPMHPAHCAADSRCRHASAETAGRSQFERETRSVSSFGLALSRCEC